MEVRCGDSAWEQSNKVVVWPQEHHREMLVRAGSSTSFNPKTDHLQMSHSINVPANRSFLPVMQAHVLLPMNRMASQQQTGPLFGLASTPSTTKKQKHHRPEHNQLLVAHKGKRAFNLGSLESRHCRSNVLRQSHASFIGQSKRDAMVCIVLTPWVDHGPKPKPNPKPKPTQPKPIPSV